MMRTGHMSGAMLVATMLATAQRVEAQAPSEPTAAEAAEIGQGRVVVIEHDVEGTPWPRVRLYRFIDATPEQSAAMFADYEHQRDYNPDLKQVTIGQRLDSARAEVSYRYASNIAFVSDVTYTVLDRISRDSTGSYLIDWRLLSGSKVKHTEGSARFAPWTNPVSGQRGTLLTYDNYVVPDFRFASLGVVRAKAIGAMRRAVDAIAVEVLRERTSDATRLDRQLAALRSILPH
jgi:hypothetical protein